MGEGMRRRDSHYNREFPLKCKHSLVTFSFMMTSPLVHIRHLFMDLLPQTHYLTLILFGATEILLHIFSFNVTALNTCFYADFIRWFMIKLTFTLNASGCTRGDSDEDEPIFEASRMNGRNGSPLNSSAVLIFTYLKAVILKWGNLQNRGTRKCRKWHC